MLKPKNKGLFCGYMRDIYSHKTALLKRVLVKYSAEKSSHTVILREGLGGFEAL